MVRTYSDELEYDLWERGEKLGNIWRLGGGDTNLTWRKLQLIIERLPPESALKTAIRDNMTFEDRAKLEGTKQDPFKHGRWSKDQVHLVEIIDRLNWMIHQHNVKNGKKGQKIAPPEPYPRPGVVPKGRSKGNSIQTRKRIQHIREMARDRGVPGAKVIASVVKASKKATPKE